MTTLRAMAGGNATVLRNPQTTTPPSVLRALVAVRNDAGESQATFALRLGTSRECVELAEAGRYSRTTFLTYVEHVLRRCGHGMDRAHHAVLMAFVRLEHARIARTRHEHAVLDLEHGAQDRKDEEQW